MASKACISLTEQDVELLNDVVEYYLSDDKEKNDFKERYGPEINQAFDMFDDLDTEHEIFNSIKEAEIHIYFKLVKLQKEILGAYND